MHRTTTIYKWKPSKTDKKCLMILMWEDNFLPWWWICFTSQDINWWTGGVCITCVFISCLDSFTFMFWRHPFTAEDPLVSKLCNATFLWWTNKLIYILNDMGCIPESTVNLPSAKPWTFDWLTPNLAYSSYVVPKTHPGVSSFNSKYYVPG